MAKRAVRLLLVVVMAFSLFGTTISAQANGNNYRYMDGGWDDLNWYDTSWDDNSCNDNYWYDNNWYDNYWDNYTTPSYNGYDQPSNQPDGSTCPSNNNGYDQPCDQSGGSTCPSNNNGYGQPCDQSGGSSCPNNNNNNSGQPSNQPGGSTTPGGQTTTDQNISSAEQQMVNLVNQARKQNGLPALQVDNQLTKIARMKSKDMIDKNYFSHTSPTYGSPFDMLKKFGVSFRSAGENLAGNQTVERAHESLMNSSGHRANILGSDYTHIGIGIQKGGPYGSMYTQIFMSGGSSSPSNNNNSGQPSNQPGGPTTPSDKPNTPGGQTTTNQNISSAEQQMINLVNQARRQNGLPALQADSQLTKIARMKSQDMIDKNYFSHTSPTYGSPFDMLKKFGVSFRSAGENLAGNQTVERAHESLMNSSGHRANILGSDYTHIGIGIKKGGPYGSMYTQIFMRK